MSDHVADVELTGVRRIVSRFIGFAGVGAISTAVQYVLLFLLVELAGLLPAISSSLGFGVSALLNYYLNYRFVYRSTAAHRDALPRFAGMALVGLALNGMLMWLLTSRLSVHYLAAQVLTTGAVLVWNFYVSSRWIYRP